MFMKKKNLNADMNSCCCVRCHKHIPCPFYCFNFNGYVETAVKIVFMAYKMQLH